MCHNKQLIASSSVLVTTCAVTAGLCTKNGKTCFDLEIFRKSSSLVLSGNSTAACSPRMFVLMLECRLVTQLGRSKPWKISLTADKVSE